MTGGQENPIHMIHAKSRNMSIMNAVLTLVSVISLVSSGFAVYNSMDNRLTRVETKQQMMTQSNLQMRKDFHDQFSSINNKLDRLTAYLMDRGGRRR